MNLILRNTWPILLGMLMLQLGNGLQGTLLGIRGAIEGMSPQTLSWVMTGYFVGFLGGSRYTPIMIRNVGHVRVYAALGSLISAALIMYAALPNEWVWFALRVLVGFCISGIYVVSESWLNGAVTNDVRGKTLSLYLIVQMIGIISAQFLLNLADAKDFTLFVVMSVVVSLSFAPVLLAVKPTPVFNTAKGMSFMQLYKTSPLGIVGVFMLGGVFAALFGMSSVFGTEKGFSVANISLFVSAIFVGGMVLQFPIGWVSDRMDRRILIAGMCLVGSTFSFGGMLSDNFIWLLVCAFMIGGIANPLYSLYLAYTNDFLDYDDMAAASGGLIFVNGVGAVIGPIVIGWLFGRFGPDSFFVYLGGLMLLMFAYSLWRMTQRAAVPVDETSTYAPISQTSTAVAAEVAAEYAIDTAQAEAEMKEKIDAVLSFWLDEVPREKWYNGDEALDEDIKGRFLNDYWAAVNGELTDWESSREGALALLIILDQFARNMFRGDAQSFKGDKLARSIARRAILKGYDRDTEGEERQFFFTPFMHSEKLDDQDYSVELYQLHSNDGDDLHAQVHREIIRKFKRFPYRNEALGRKSTKAELKFMKDGGYRSLVEKFEKARE